METITFYARRDAVSGDWYWRAVVGGKVRRSGCTWMSSDAALRAAVEMGYALGYHKPTTDRQDDTRIDMRLAPVVAERAQ